MTKFIPLILFTVLTNFLSQILLKKGMTTIGKFDLTISGLMSSALDVLLNWYIIGGIIVMVISMACHLVVLSRVEISFAYPFLGLSFVLITIYGHFALDEAVTIWRVAGVLLISAGVALVART
ncbi:MAG: transporter [Methylophaga sp.]|nr:MAG: transporter [Methylophaga sp.]